MRMSASLPEGCSRGVSVLLAVLMLGAVAWLPVAPVMGQNTDAAAAVPDDATPEMLFRDFLHYARLGRFTIADAYAKALLEHPQLDPVKIADAADKDRQSLRTLQMIIENSTISERASAVLALIQEGEFEQRKDAETIRRNIELLAGTPQQEHIARQRLHESGEYAIPHMIEFLLDPTKKDMHTRIVYALPAIGKEAVGPLVMGLRLTPQHEATRLHVIWALGELGYPQAAPYLKAYMQSDAATEQGKEAAQKAMTRIEKISGRPIVGEAADLFYLLADKYYNENDAVRADPTLPKANLWYFNDDTQLIESTVVPQRLFGPIMAMRSSEEALRLAADRIDAIALWLAANIRRESRLGLNVESGDPDELPSEPDPTKPADYPRALYFTQAAGPRYAHLVLDRAVRDRDAAVALGAIEALRLTAGESSLIGTEDFKQPLVQALQFPNLVVRTRAALALGQALPKSPFAGSHKVVPVLAAALNQSGQQQFLVVTSDEDNFNRLMGELRGSDTDVIGEATFYKAMNRARVEFAHLSGVFLDSDLNEPSVVEAVNMIRGEFAFAHVPVVLLAGTSASVSAKQLVEGDPYTDMVDASLGRTELMSRYEAVLEATGQQALAPELALSIALQAADTLGRIAGDGRTVFDEGLAEPALIAALSSPEESLQISAGNVLSYFNTPTAQRAIAFLAMQANNPNTLRVPMFASLASSAKRGGNMLEAEQIKALVELARTADDLVIRTAASKALGALNISNNQASEIIRAQYNG